MAKNKFYGVRDVGVFDNWDACSAAVKGVSGALYKGFATIEEAEAYARGEVPQSSKTQFYAIRGVGIVNTWEECLEAVKGVSGAEYRKFKDIESAESWYYGIGENTELEDGIYFAGMSGKCLAMSRKNGQESIKIFSVVGADALYAEYLAGCWLREQGYTESYCLSECMEKWSSGEWQCKAGYDFTKMVRCVRMSDAMRNRVKGILRRGIPCGSLVTGGF